MGKIGGTSTNAAGWLAGWLAAWLGDGEGGDNGAWAWSVAVLVPGAPFLLLTNLFKGLFSKTPEQEGVLDAH